MADYRECSVCSALLTDDEVWSDSSGSVVYTTSSLQTPLDALNRTDQRRDITGEHYRRLKFEEPGIGSEATTTVDVSMNGVLCEHCYVQQETTEFSGSYDFSDADELDPWAMFDE